MKIYLAEGPAAVSSDIPIPVYGANELYGILIPERGYVGVSRMGLAHPRFFFNPKIKTPEDLPSFLTATPVEHSGNGLEHILSLGEEFDMAERHYAEGLDALLRTLFPQYPKE